MYESWMNRLRQEGPFVIAGGTDDTDGGDGGDDAGGEGGEKPPKSYSKAELDAIVAKAVAKRDKNFADYQMLKEKADELDALKTQSQTAEERMRLQHDRAVKERDNAVGRAERALIRSAVVAEAAKQGAVDPDAVAALVDRTDLVIEEDRVEGAEEAVRALLAAKSYLLGKAGAARRAGADMAGGGQGTAPTTTVARSQHRRWLRGEDGGMTTERQKLVDDAMRHGRYMTDR